MLTIQVYIFIILLSLEMSESSKFRYLIAESKALMKIATSIIPPLNYISHKGTMGRIAVIGGSPEYTGAPYYAAQASLKFGGDLAYVFCEKQALIPIKSYSPELMVTSFYNATNITSETKISSINLISESLSRVNSVVIGNKTFTKVNN